MRGNFHDEKYFEENDIFGNFKLVPKFNVNIIYYIN